MKKLVLVVLVLSSLLFSPAWAQAFLIKNIEIQGLQRLSPKTVETYLPIKRGQVLQPDKTAQLIRSLYKTGFFDHISLEKRNNTLIIHLTERATIGQLTLSGNSIIPSDKLKTVMKSMEIAEGRIYNAVMLERIKQSLLNQYYQLGRYNARVDVQVTSISRNRVLVKILISEGLVAKIRRISIIGNHAFTEDEILKQISISTPGLLTFFTQTDRYSEEKLQAASESIKNFYLDHGYIRVQVKSSQAQVTPDRKSVYINIVIDEGQVYTVKGFNVTGEFPVLRRDLEKQIIIRSGEIFSRKKVMESEKNMTDLLGNNGYIYAAVALRPQINDMTKQLYLIFDVKAGKRTYVRRISFSDNMRTNDIVLRRELEQWEAAPVSTAKLQQSKLRLNRLPYIRDVQMSVDPAPGTSDQVDINYKVKEDSSAQASFRIGYSQAQKALIGAGINHKNFLGTGKTLGLNFTRSSLEQYYGIDYTDPYYTEDGISRSFSISFAKTDPDNVKDLNSSYTSNEFRAGVLFGIPLGQEQGVFNHFDIGLGYQYTLLNIIQKNVSNQVSDFVHRHGKRFQEADLTLGFSRDSRDKAIFPTQGVLQTIYLDTYLPLAKSSISFYTVNYHAILYQSLTHSFIATARADLGYGNGFHGIKDFPFFKNYYAGGIDSVHGYEDYSLGPRDSRGKSFGGNILADASVGLIFPNYLSENLRTMVFLDAGNVYLNGNNRDFGGESTNSGPLRYSIGIEADWLTPIGWPIKVSLATPIKKRAGDKRDIFQFSLGASF